MIELQNVSKIYKNNKYAINDISLVISAGEFVYIVGHSGAGKSTLLRLIYRQEKATKGKVVINGRDVSKIRYSQVPGYRREVGFVFQDYQLLPHKTAYENIAYALEVRGEHRRKIQVRVREVLDLVGLKDKEKSYPSQLSGGEQQRVAIARAIINRPSILIADEPTGNLDPKTSQTIIEVLKTINQLGTTVVVATHDQYMVNNYPQRTITFKNGVIYHDALDSGYVVGDDDFDTEVLERADETADKSILDVVRDELKDKAVIQQLADESVTEVQEEFLALFAEQEKQRQQRNASYSEIDEERLTRTDKIVADLDLPIHEEDRVLTRAARRQKEVK